MYVIYFDNNDRYYEDKDYCSYDPKEATEWEEARIDPYYYHTTHETYHAETLTGAEIIANSLVKDLNKWEEIVIAYDENADEECPQPPVTDVEPGRVVTYTETEYIGPFQDEIGISVYETHSEDIEYEGSAQFDHSKTIKIIDSPIFV